MTQPHPDDVTYAVYTTQQPDVRQEVSALEYAELKAMGLIAREESKPEVAKASDAKAQVQKPA